MAINPWSAEHPVPSDKFGVWIDQIADYDRFPADTITEILKNPAILMIQAMMKFADGLKETHRSFVENRGHSEESAEF